MADSNFDSANWELVFADEFDGTEVDRSKWNTNYYYGSRTNLWNDESQYYVDDSFTFDDGILSITAEKLETPIEAFEAADQYLLPLNDKSTSFDYTSGLLSSDDKVAFTYGHIEIEAKIPKGQGLWPAFWLLPASGEWPPEIDVVEALGHDTETIYNSYHYRDSTSAEHAFESYGFNNGVDFAADFHTYGVNWDENSIRWFVDDQEVFSVTENLVHQPMYLLANLAVGGFWAGAPDETTPLSSSFDIDYIRVYQQASGELYGGSADDELSRIYGSLFGEEGNDLLRLEASGYVSGGEGDDQLIAGIGASVLEGGNGQDWLWGNAGNDVMTGEAGRDRFILGNEAEAFYSQGGQVLITDFNLAEDVLQLYGQSTDYRVETNAVSGGSEVLLWRGEAAIARLQGVDTNRFSLTDSYVDYWGKPDVKNVIAVPEQPDANRLLHGTITADTLLGGSGNDELFGDQGHDVLIGGSGSDQIFAGDDNDNLYGEDDDDVLFGELGDDKLYAGAGNDLLYGGLGNDWVTGDDGSDQLYGDLGDDTLIGGADADLLYGGNGQDSLYGDAGADELYGEQGDDLLDAGDGEDAVYGGNGNDKLYGGAGADQLYGDLGHDLLYGGAGNDDLSGGFGDDRLDGGAGDDHLYGDVGADELFGGEGADTLIGAAGADSLYGGTGNDLIIGESGRDLVYGEAGDDVIYAGSEDDQAFGGGGDDQLYGSWGSDLLQGDAGADQLFGEAGSDRLIGGAGNDRLEGGEGSDWLIGTDSALVRPGTGEVDELVGGGGGDRFVLGDDRVYYLDLDTRTGQRLNVTESYATVLDFNLYEDVVELAGDESYYRLGRLSSNAPTTGLWYQSSLGQEDLVAVLDQVEVKSFARGFEFV